MGRGAPRISRSRLTPERNAAALYPGYSLSPHPEEAEGRLEGWAVESAASWFETDCHNRPKDGVASLAYGNPPHREVLRPEFLLILLVQQISRAASTAKVQPANKKYSAVIRRCI